MWWRMRGRVIDVWGSYFSWDFYDAVLDWIGILFRRNYVRDLYCFIDVCCLVFWWVIVIVSYCLVGLRFRTRYTYVNSMMDFVFYSANLLVLILIAEIIFYVFIGMSVLSQFSLLFLDFIPYWRDLLRICLLLIILFGFFASIVLTLCLSPQKIVGIYPISSIFAIHNLWLHFFLYYW